MSEQKGYEIWVPQGQGGPPTGDSFSSLEKAMKYIETKKGEGSFAIMKPDGTFYDWNGDVRNMLIRERRHVMVGSFLWAALLLLCMWFFP